jgi:hypothetical protein
MLARCKRAAVNLLVSASVLVSALVPPPVCHDHDGGSDSSHRHGSFGHHCHSHSPSDPPDHAFAALESPEGLGSFDRHHHWKLLGIEFSTPCDDEDCEDDQQDQPLLVRSVGGASVVSHDGNGIQAPHLIASPEPALEPVANTVSTLRTNRFTSSIPLCDSARLERTGVRLA